MKQLFFILSLLSGCSMAFGQIPVHFIGKVVFTDSLSIGDSGSTKMAAFDFTPSSQTISSDTPFVVIAGDPATDSLSGMDATTGFGVSTSFLFDAGVGHSTVWTNTGIGHVFGENTDDGGGFPFPKLVTESYWSMGRTDSSTVAFWFTGLDNSKTYNITIITSLDDGTFGGSGIVSDFKIGGLSQHQDPVGNTSHTLTWTNVSPSSGKIPVYMFGCPCGTDHTYSVINGATIKEN